MKTIKSIKNRIYKDRVLGSIMRRIFILSVVFLVSKTSSAQTSFSDCHDTLWWRLTHDTTGFNLDANLNWQECVKGKQMPYLSLQTISGENIETKQLLGKIIVFNLWFTTCYPCIAEMPALNKLVREYKNKNVVFLGLSTDSKEILEKQFFPKHKFDFIIIPAAGPIIDKIGQTGYPTT